MSKSPTKIVITGMGVISPLGIGSEAFAEGLAAAKSVVHVPRYDNSVRLPFGVCSDLGDFDPKKLVKPRKSVKLMCREVQLGVAAAQLAVNDAQLEVAAADSNRFGTVLGSEMLYGPPIELADIFAASSKDGEFQAKEFGRSMSELFPLWMLRYLPNMPACHAAIAQQAHGPSNSIVQGDASSLLALCEAITVMERGWTDIMIAGGTGSTILPVRAVYFDERKYSHRDSNPAAASRPFDVDRDGMACGEGSATFVLETEAHAAARGAKLLAIVGGFGRAFELDSSFGPEMHGPSTRATRRAIARAMAEADVRPEDIDHVNAHGLSTVASDRREAQAIREELGDVPVTAPKSYFGNLGAGSGAVELAASILGMGSGRVPPTLNYETPDPECPVNVISGQPKPLRKKAIVSLSQSSTGQTVAIVLLRV